jgi:hypothetical protein
MPYIGHIIPTNQKQDTWEQKNLLPSMFGDIIEDVKRSIEETRRLKEKIKIKEAKIEEMKKHGKFVNGEYIPNKQPNQKKESKDKSKIIEDVKEMIKNTESKKKKKHSSDINVTQEYDKLLNDLDQLQKTKQKMIDEVTSMLEIPKIKKSSLKNNINDLVSTINDVIK